MLAHENIQTERRFIWSLALTSLIFLAELIGGLWTGSLALLSDSAHVFLDVFALGLSYGALRLSARPADDRHTFGFHRLEVLAALINGLTLGLIAFGIFREALERWQTPQSIKTGEMLVIAVIGLAVNLWVAFILRGEQHHHVHDAGEDHSHEDLNMHSAFLHVLGDAISSLGVILAAVLIGQTGLTWIDPLMSVVIGVIILWGSGRVLRSSVHILVEGTPEGMSLDEVAATMTAVPGIYEVHDLHVWNLCSGHIALSAHAVLHDKPAHEYGLILMELQRRLKRAYGIQHTTIQLENHATIQGQLVDIR